MAEASAGVQELPVGSFDIPQDEVKPMNPVFNVPFEGRMATVEVNEKILRDRLYDYLTAKKVPDLSARATAAAVTFTYKEADHLGQYDPNKMECNLNIQGIAQRASEIKRPPLIAAATKVRDLSATLNEVWNRECALVFEKEAFLLVNEKKWAQEQIAKYTAPMLSAGLLFSKTLAIAEAQNLFANTHNLGSLQNIAVLFLAELAVQAAVNRYVSSTHDGYKDLMEAMKLDEINPFKIEMK